VRTVATHRVAQAPDAAQAKPGIAADTDPSVHAREAKERELTILRESAISAATSNSVIQLGNNANNEPHPEKVMIDTLQRDLAVAVRRREDAAVEQLRASQAWAADAKQHGSSEDISKSEAWVKEAKLDLQVAQPQGETL
jgi:hypothetical protein